MDLTRINTNKYYKDLFKFVSNPNSIVSSIRSGDRATPE
jgi:hypothetical protein